MPKLLKKDFSIDFSKDGNSLIVKYRGATILNLNVKNIQGITFEVDDAKNKDIEKKANTFFKAYIKSYNRSAKENNHCKCNYGLKAKPTASVLNKFKEIVKKLDILESENDDLYNLYKNYINTINDLYIKGANSALFDGSQKLPFVSLDILKRDNALALYKNENYKTMEVTYKTEAEIKYCKFINKIMYKSFPSEEDKKRLKALSKKAFNRITEEVECLCAE